MEFPRTPYNGPFRTPVFVLHRYYDHFDGRWYVELRQSKKAPLGRWMTEEEALDFADRFHLRVQRQVDGVFIREGKGEWNV